jgi:hypothetical protein
MKYTLLVIAAAAALAASGAAYSSLAAGGPSEDPFVVGGGRFGPGCFDVLTTFCFANPRDLSVDADLEKKGTKVTGVINYGNNDGVLRNRVDVTCVSIVGNRAAIGGIIRESGSAETVGFGALIFLISNGSPGQPTRDRSSPLFIDALGPAWPEGFPYTCPAPNSPINNIGFQALHSGDIVISDGND